MFQVRYFDFIIIIIITYIEKENTHALNLQAHKPPTEMSVFYTSIIYFKQ
jgi:hypothetical protein